MLSNIFTIISVITIVTANIQLKPCESKVQSIKVFPSTGETVEWDLQDSFFRGTYLSYSLSPSNTSFQIQKPFAQSSSPQPHVESVNKVTATRALTGKGQRVWMNHFAFINVELDRIEVFYSEGQQGDNLHPPQFSKKINVPTNSSFISCLGVEYVNQDLFILDCLDSAKLPFTNKLFVVDKVGNSRIFENSNFNQYSVNSRRISQSIVITNKLLREHTYLLRSTPAFATQQAGLDLNSIIEVFYIEQDGTPRLQSVLDAPLLGVLLDVKDLDHFTFSLIDFRAFPNGLIYILTAKEGVYIIELLGNGEFALKDRIFPNIEQAYGFDVDYIIQEDGTLKEVIAILYDDFIQMIEDKQPTKKYVLEFVANYPASISLTQQFLILKFKGITYLFSTEYEDFIHKETIEGAKGYLINPYVPELIAITSLDSRRITFTHGLLRFPSTNVPLSTLTQIQLIANDTNLAQCKVLINYKVFNSSDYSVQAVDELKIQDLIYDTPEPFYIEPLVSGPHLNFAQLLQDSVEGTTISASITQIQEMMFNEISFPPSILIVYSDVLIIDAINERYALLVQTSDKVVTIYNCEIQNKFIAKSDCVQYKSQSLNIKLAQNNFLWWHQGQNIYYLTIENDYNAVIRESQLNQTSIIGEFSYSENPLNIITSVTVLKDRFLFILGNRKQIDIRSTTSPYDIEYSITEETIKNRGFTGNWNPQRIFGNRAHNSYIFFIANEDNVIVADYHKQLTIIKTITLSKGTINLAVGIERFFIILKSSTVSLIQEYDLTNLNSVQLMKNLPLYWFTLQTPLQTDFCSHTGVLFVRAYDVLTNQTVVLTYSPGKLLRDSLLQVLYLEFMIPDGTSINLSSAGSNQMVVYTNSGKLQKIYSIFSEPVFTLSPKYDQNIYFSTYTLKFQVSNFEDVTPASYSQVINLVNTQIGIKVDQGFLNRRRLNVTKTDSIYDLSTGWFEGQVVNLEIGCEQCNDKIIPIQTVQQIGSGKFSGYQIVDAAPLKGSRTVQLANKLNKRVLITDEDNELITTYSINLSSESDVCDHITASEDGEFIFTTCKVYGKVSVHVAKCTTTGQLECHQFGTVQSIEETSMISQIEVYGNYLFVLDSNPNQPQQYEGSLNMYKWTAETSQITFSLAKQLNKVYFGQKPLHFSSFYFTTYKNDKDQYYKILLLESSNILYSIDGFTNNLGEITWFEAYKSLDLYVYINQAGYFVTQSSQFQSIKPIAASQYSSASDILTTYTLITTDYSAHYAIQLDFKSYNISTKSIIYILNQYSTLPALNKVSVGNGYAVIPYLDINEILLASYALPSINVSGKPLVKFVGGITAQFFFSQISEFVIYIPNNIAQPRLYSNIKKDTDSNENLLTTYSLNTNFQIQVFNSDGTVSDQFVLLTLANQFNQDSGLVYLKIVKEKEEQIWDQIINLIW